MRRNVVAKVSFGEQSFRMEMLENDWGPDDPILNQALKGEFDENLSLAWWTFFCKAAPEGSVVVDVGAYSGLFSLLAMKTRPDIRIVAIEPSAVTWSRLIRNINLNLGEANILPANLAALDSESWLSFEHPYGIYTMCPGESALARERRDHTASARTFRLDLLLGTEGDLPDYLNAQSYSFLPTNKIVALKIDVEGVEIGVLAGTKRLISAARPCIICEALSESAKERLVSFFNNFNYEYIDIMQERNLVFIPAEKIKEYVHNFETYSSSPEGQTKLRAYAELTFFIS